MGKQFVIKALRRYVTKYFQKHPEVQLVVVTGSMGKSSTMRTMADIFAQKHRVRMHESDDMTPEFVPLAVLGIDLPTATAGILAWWRVLRAAQARVSRAADADIVIVELPITRPGDMAMYASYLHPNLACITAIAPENQPAFGTIDELAQEYMAVSRLAQYVLVNRDDIDARYADFETSAEFSTYGTSGSAEYRFETDDMTLQSGYTGSVISVNFEPFPATLHVIGEHSIRPMVGAIAAAMRLGLTPDEIRAGLDIARPLGGRMNVLLGFGDTTLIDDTYDANPATVAAAIKTLYACEDETISERIAVISDVPGLGQNGAAEYGAIGTLADPALMTWLITVGPETAQYLAPAARQKGCQVRCARNAIEAAEMVRAVSQPRALILLSGSRDWYLEETVKLLCDESQSQMLVRQDPELSAAKQAHFEQFAQMP